MYTKGIICNCTDTENFSLKKHNFWKERNLVTKNQINVWQFSYYSTQTYKEEASAYASEMLILCQVRSLNNAFRNYFNIWFDFIAIYYMYTLSCFLFYFTNYSINWKTQIISTMSSQCQLKLKQKWSISTLDNCAVHKKLPVLHHQKMQQST